MTTTEAVQYLSVTETARVLRPVLGRAFPDVGFRVRSQRYANGASITVEWSGGPSLDAVQAVTSQYAGAHFDGVIDLMTYRTHWLCPGGAVLLAHEPGTLRAGGELPKVDNRPYAQMIRQDARLVRFGADFISCARDGTY